MPHTRPGPAHGARRAAEHPPCAAEPQHTANAPGGGEVAHCAVVDLAEEALEDKLVKHGFALWWAPKRRWPKILARPELLAWFRCTRNGWQPYAAGSSRRSLKKTIKNKNDNLWP